jgi:hypothetical protein
MNSHQPNLVATLDTRNTGLTRVARITISPRWNLTSLLVRCPGKMSLGSYVKQTKEHRPVSKQTPGELHFLSLIASMGVVEGKAHRLFRSHPQPRPRHVIQVHLKEIGYELYTIMYCAGLRSQLGWKISSHQKGREIVLELARRSCKEEPSRSHTPTAPQRHAGPPLMFKDASDCRVDWKRSCQESFRDEDDKKRGFRPVP